MAIILPHGVLFRGGMEERTAPSCYNLNISRYVSTAQEEVEIDLKATHAELVKVEKTIHEATAKHNKFLKELAALSRDAFARDRILRSATIHPVEVGNKIPRFPGRDVVEVLTMDLSDRGPLPAPLATRREQAPGAPVKRPASRQGGGL